MPRDDSANWLPIESAPRTGVEVVAANFSNRFFCNWTHHAVAFRKTWKAVDDPRGEVFLDPTHWKPVASQQPGEERLRRLDEALTLLGVERVHHLHEQLVLITAIQSFALATGDEGMEQACSARMARIRAGIAAGPQS